MGVVSIMVIMRDIKWESCSDCKLKLAPVLLVPVLLAGLADVHFGGLLAALSFACRRRCCLTLRRPRCPRRPCPASRV